MRPLAGGTSQSLGRSVAGTATLFVVLIAMVWLLAWAFQRRMIYFPFGGVPSPEDVGLARVETVHVPTRDGIELSGWFVPAAGDRASVTAIVFNGNAGNRAYRAALAKRLAERGIATVLFDYRGYGGNAGTPSETGLSEDARAIRRYVESRRDVRTDRIVYFGESLGAAVALGLAIERPPRALVLRSPFTSLADVGAHHYPFLPVRWLLRDRFASIDRISRLACPVLVIAAEQDSIIPLQQSVRLYEAAPQPKRLLVVPGTDHNDDALLGGTPMIEAMIAFLGRE